MYISKVAVETASCDNIFKFNVRGTRHYNHRHATGKLLKQLLRARHHRAARDLVDYKLSEPTPKFLSLFIRQWHMKDIAIYEFEFGVSTEAAKTFVQRYDLVHMRSMVIEKRTKSIGFDVCRFNNHAVEIEYQCIELQLNAGQNVPHWHIHQRAQASTELHHLRIE